MKSLKNNDADRSRLDQRSKSSHTLGKLKSRKVWKKAKLYKRYRSTKLTYPWSGKYKTKGLIGNTGPQKGYRLNKQHARTKSFNRNRKMQRANNLQRSNSRGRVLKAGRRGRPWKTPYPWAVQKDSRSRAPAKSGSRSRMITSGSGSTSGVHHAGNCHGAGAYAGKARQDEWCKVQCAVGYCPETHCSCSPQQ